MIRIYFILIIFYYIFDYNSFLIFLFNEIYSKKYIIEIVISIHIFAYMFRVWENSFIISAWSNLTIIVVIIALWADDDNLEDCKLIWSYERQLWGLKLLALL